MLTGDMVTPAFNFKDVKTVPTFESVDEIQWCDIQIEPFMHCFHMVLFVFQYVMK